MESFIAQFERYAGAERYAKFMGTLRGQCRVEKRLMYWQEQLLSEFAASIERPALRSLADVVALFAVEPRQVNLGAFDGAIPIVGVPVVREFRSVKQNASGGSHVTVFEVQIGPSHTTECNLIDCAAPHDEYAVAEEIMDALERGVSRFVADSNDTGIYVSGFDIRLLSYVHNSIDFKPSKHQMAIHFLLQDLFSETRTGRHVSAKLVGIPL